MTDIMPNKTIHVKIADKQMLTDDILSLTLAKEDGSALLKFEAGANIDVHIGSNTDTKIIRQYSLCSNPSDTSQYRLGILKDPDSRGGSTAIHDSFNQGDIIEISEPRNLFPLDVSAEHSILVGGGIGITPMIAMAYTLKSLGKSFEIHYCIKSTKKSGFVDELQAHFGNSLNLYCSELGDDQRLQPKNDFNNLSDSTHLYTCGPTGFMDWVITSAKEMGLPESNIHFEYFNVDVDISGESFTIVTEQSGKTIEVSGDESITDALTKAGIKIDISCEQGICGTCIVDVLEGEPDHRDQFLTDEEKEDNDQIAVCCSRSKSGTLVLDI